MLFSFVWLYLRHTSFDGIGKSQAGRTRRVDAHAAKTMMSMLNPIDTASQQYSYRETSTSGGCASRLCASIEGLRTCFSHTHMSGLPPNTLLQNEDGRLANDETMANLMDVYQDLKHSSTPQVHGASSSLKGQLNELAQLQAHRADFLDGYSRGSFYRKRESPKRRKEHSMDPPALEYAQRGNEEPGRQTKKQRKPRFRWTEELHRNFIVAVFEGTELSM